MALFLPGKTNCGLCHDVIAVGEPFTCFPAFIAFDHPLGKFSDAVFHSRCFEQCPERPAIEKLYNQFRQIWDSRPRGLKTLAEMEAWGIEAFRNFPGEG
jgi:hypothetical protein